MLANNMLILYGVFVSALVMFGVYRKKLNGFWYVVSVGLIVLYGFSLVFINVFVVSYVYERDVKRRSSLTHIVDRVILLGGSGDNFNKTPLKANSNESCVGLVENENLHFDDLVYGRCTFREGATNAQFDRFWWLGRDRVIIKFPISAYRIPWIQEKVDLAIQNPCKYIPQDRQSLSDWQNLKCDKGLKQNLTNKVRL